MKNDKLNSDQASSVCGQYEELCIFNGFSFPLMPGMGYFMDGPPGKRVLFITDECKEILITFEQGMKHLDISFQREARTPIYSEYRMGNKYLHQQKLLSTDEKVLNKCEEYKDIIKMAEKYISKTIYKTFDKKEDTHQAAPIEQTAAKRYGVMFLTT